MLATRWKHTLVGLTAALTMGLAAPHLCSQERDWDQLFSEGVWLDFNTGFARVDVQSIAIDPENPDRLYTGADGFIYRSVDRGDLWRPVYRQRQRGRSAGRVGSTSNLVQAIEDLTDDQIDEVQSRVDDLEQDLFDDLVDDIGEFEAALAVESQRDRLLEEAILEVFEAPSASDLPGDLIAEFAASLEAIPENLVTQLVVDPVRRGRVYAASGRGVMASDDFGASWTQYFRGVGRNRRRVTSLVVAPDRVLLATETGLFFSTNDGDEWQRLTGPPARREARFITIAPSDSSRIYAVADGRIYASHDGGASFTPRAVPLGVAASDFGNLAVAPDNPDRVYAATRSGVYISNDAGVSFRASGYVGLYQRQVTWVKPAGASHLVAGTVDGIFVSADGGSTWAQLPRGLTGSVIHQVDVAQGRLWISTNRGVFRLMSPDEVVTGEEAARRARESWAADPDVGQTVQAALVYYGYDSIPVDEYSARIYWSQFMPRATFRYTLRPRRLLSQNFVPDLNNDPQRTDRRWIARDDHQWLVYFRWDLQAIIFDTRQVTQRDVHDRIIRRRRDLIRRIIRAYDARRELLLRMAEGRANTPLRQAADQLRLGALTAQLDVFCGGFFSAYAEVSRR